MNGLKKAPDGAHAINFTNGTGSTIAAGSVVDLGSLGWGVVYSDIADGDTGVAWNRGWFELTKVTGASSGFAQGETVFWDASNSRCDKTAVSKPLGTAVETVADGATAVVVNLNAGPEVFAKRVTGSGASPGIEIDTGFGEVPNGPIVVVSKTAAGVLRSITSVVEETGGDAGKITVITSEGAADDTHDVLVYN